MAPKIKNGLLRVQCYLTEETYQNFRAEFNKFNDERKEENEPQLSESGFCHLKLTGAFPRLRGAPHGNRNALGRKNNSTIDASQDDALDESSRAPFAAENPAFPGGNFDPPSSSPKAADNSRRNDVSGAGNIKNENDSDSTDTEQSQRENFHEKTQNESPKDDSFKALPEQPETENFDEENPLELALGKDENSFVNLTVEIPAIGETIKHPAAEILITETEDATAAKKNSGEDNTNNLLTNFSDEMIDDLLTKFNDVSQTRRKEWQQAEMPPAANDLGEEILLKEVSSQIGNGDNQAHKPEADKEYSLENKPVEQARLF